MNQNPFIAFLQETFARFAAKSPKFFRVWQIVLGFATVVTGLPAALEEWGVTLPPELTYLQSKFIGTITLGAFIMTQLSTPSKTIGVTPTGEVIKRTSDALPFTKQAEAKKIEKMEVPEVKVLTTDPNPVLDRQQKNSI